MQPGQLDRRNKWPGEWLADENPFEEKMDIQGSYDETAALIPDDTKMSWKAILLEGSGKQNNGLAILTAL